MILSASRRTDIPAFYSHWFLQRLQAGFFLVRNPMNPRQISRVTLHPTVVDCIVFWTKDVGPLLPYLKNIRQLGYEFYIQYTITPYGLTIEPGLPAIDERIASFQQAATLIGRERLVWRYDPILFNPDWDVDRHSETFAQLAAALASSADECIFSIIEPYRKTLRNTKALQLLTNTRAAALPFIEQMATIASSYRLPLNTCADQQDYAHWGIGHAACISRARIEELLGVRLAVHSDPNQREFCGCVSSIDMGAYNTCRHGCRYCYANASATMVERNCALHDPESSLLIGKIGPEDAVKDRAAHSLIDPQLPLL